MAQIVKTHAVVQKGGLIEVHAPGIPVGSEAEVLIKVQSDAKEPILRLSSLIGSGTGLYKTAAEVDDQLAGLRKEWPR